MSYIANWSYPTSIKFGPGRVEYLPQACGDVGIKRPVLVTDRALASLPITERALHLLRSAGIAVTLFSDVDSNPTEANLTAGLEH